MFFKALGHYFLEELKNLKHHIWGFFSILVKYIAPLIFLFSTCVVKTETRTKVESWALPIIAIMVIIYFFAIRKKFREKKIEEKVVGRLAPQQAEPLRLAFFALIDDCIMAPLLPFILYLCAKSLERLGAKISDAMLIMTILFVVGGVLKLIDVLVNMTRVYKENLKKKESK